MTAISPVGTFVQPNYTTQSGSAYPLGLDAAMAVAARLIGTFAPHPASPPSLSVVVDGGHIYNPATRVLTEVAAQTVAITAAPASGTSRIDRVVINRYSGLASVTAGVAAVAPVAPAIPPDACPVARVTVAAGCTAIISTLMADERDFTGLGQVNPGLYIDAADTTPGTLAGKLLAGSGITLTLGGAGGNETLTAAADTSVLATTASVTNALAGKQPLTYMDILPNNATLSGAHNNHTIAANSAIALNIPNPAVLGDNWAVDISATGGAITLYFAVPSSVFGVGTVSTYAIPAAASVRLSVTGGTFILTGTGAPNYVGGLKITDFPNNLSGNGYQKLPNGLIIQWGLVGSNAPFNFPIVFPNSVLGMAASPIGGQPQGLAVSAVTTTGSTIQAGGNYTSRFIAIGC